jgi:F-box-like
MFISKNYAVPELLDTVLGYLEHHDLYNCSLVNKQFSAHATPALYRDLSFQLHTHIGAERTRQKNLFATFRQSPRLASNIRQIKIVLDTSYGLRHKSKDECTKFGDEIAHILQNSSCLENLSFDNQCRGGPTTHDDEIVCQALITILCAVHSLESSRMIELALLHSLDGTGNNDVEGRQLAQLFGSRVFSLSVGEISSTHLQALGGFSQLNNLVLTWSLPHETYRTADLETIFDGVPLTNLELDYGSVLSFPRTVQTLRLGERQGGTLSRTAWQAICRLKELSQLDFCLDIEPWHAPPTIFCSPKLRSLTVRLYTRTQIDTQWLTRQIFQPIFEHHRLETVSIYIVDGDISTDLLTTIFSTAIDRTLSVRIHNRLGARTYHLPDLLTWLTSAPKLQDMRLPWPSQLFRPDHDDEDLFRWGIVLEALSFQQCQQLAALCPDLDVIQFGIGLYPWINEETSNFKATTCRKRLDALGYKCRKARKVAYLQHIKIARLIDHMSPCLHLCTILYEDRDYFREDEMVLYLSLNLVRNHAHEYLPSIDFLNPGVDSIAVRFSQVFIV